MKKTLNFFVMAFAALAFMGCDPKPQGNAAKAITKKFNVF